MNFITKVRVGNVYTKYTLSMSNIALIKWEPKSGTEIHDHDGKNCDFIVLNGSLHEARYTDKYLGALYSSKCVEPLLKTTIKKTDGYHQVFNFDNWIKYSIHKYYD
tara:strand:- start:1131 stop:1448 length:318 start_codon:yes stop_codon:yes gene_type:complete